MKKIFRIVEKDGIVIYDESDDYVPDDDDDNTVYEREILTDDDFDDVNEYVSGKYSHELNDPNLDYDYLEKHSVIVKPNDPKKDLLISVLVILGCIALIALITVFAIWQHS